MPQRKRILTDFYIYESDFASIASGGTQTNTINIQADSDFRWEKATYLSANAAALTNITVATKILPFATVLLTDTGSGRQLMDGAIPIANLFGTGEIPFILKTPKIFSARATLSITVNNFDTALALQIRLSFIGTKLFKLGG